MIYSVYNYHTGKYAYYEAPAQTPSAGWFRPQLGAVASPESIAEPLPENARYVGSGTKARGIIATDKKHADLQLMGMSWRPLPAWTKNVALAAFFFWLGRRFR